MITFRGIMLTEGDSLGVYLDKDTAVKAFPDIIRNVQKHSESSYWINVSKKDLKVLRCASYMCQFKKRTHTQRNTKFTPGHKCGAMIRLKIECRSSRGNKRWEIVVHEIQRQHSNHDIVRNNMCKTVLREAAEKMAMNTAGGTNSMAIKQPQTSFCASSNDLCNPDVHNNILHRCAWNMIWPSVSSQKRNFFDIFNVCKRVTCVLFSVRLKKHSNKHFQAWLNTLAQIFPHIEIPLIIGNTPTKLLESIGNAIFKFLLNSFEPSLFQSKLQILQTFQHNLPKEGFSNDFRCRSESHSHNVFK